MFSVGRAFTRSPRSHRPPLTRTGKAIYGRILYHFIQLKNSVVGKRYTSSPYTRRLLRETQQPPAESEVYTGCGWLGKLFHYQLYKYKTDRCYVAVYINYEDEKQDFCSLGRVTANVSDGMSKRSPSFKTYEKSLNILGGLHDEIKR